MRATITSKALQNLQPKNKPYFIRSTSGFGIKVNLSGSIKYIVEVRHRGKTIRKTIGSYPMMPLKLAREEGAKCIQLIYTGQLRSKASTTLEELLSNYLSSLDFKESALKDYKSAIPRYLTDWMNKRVTDISKEMVERRFCLIRDKGWRGGKPTYSHATKTMRILSALMNYAMADEIIERNPVDVLKQKRVKRSTAKKSSYLTQEEARKVLKCLSEHPVGQAIAP